jgi:hypothetical protein
VFLITLVSYAAGSSGVYGRVLLYALWFFLSSTFAIMVS